MSEINNFEDTVDSLFKGMNSIISSKTVVGEAVHVGDTVILPLVDVSFGIGAGSNAGDSKDAMNAGGALGGKMSPNAVLVISNGTTKLINIKGSDGISKLVDMVPDLVNKFSAARDSKSNGNVKE